MTSIDEKNKKLMAEVIKRAQEARKKTATTTKKVRDDGPPEQISGR